MAITTTRYASRAARPIRRSNSLKMPTSSRGGEARSVMVPAVAGHQRNL